MKEIDWKFAQSILAGRELEQEKMQFRRKDPRLYMAFDLIKKRLEITPVQLSNAKNLLNHSLPGSCYVPTRVAQI